MKKFFYATLFTLLPLTQVLAANPYGVDTRQAIKHFADKPRTMKIDVSVLGISNKNGCVCVKKLKPFGAVAVKRGPISVVVKNPSRIKLKAKVTLEYKRYGANKRSYKKRNVVLLPGVNYVKFMASQPAIISYGFYATATAYKTQSRFLTVIDPNMGNNHRTANFSRACKPYYYIQ